MYSRYDLSLYTSFEAKRRRGVLWFLCVSDESKTKDPQMDSKVRVSRLDLPTPHPGHH